MKQTIDEVVKLHDEEMRQYRQRVIQSYPHCPLRREHLADAQLLPNRYDMLDEMPKNAVVCEIGVAHGDFSAEIMRRCQPKRLHLVDAWEADRYSAGREQVTNRFADEIEAERIQLHIGYSTDRLPEFPDNYFDWVYVDSVHDYRITAQELAICLEKVKPGGIIAGHDYTPGNLVTPVCYGVIHAVQEFCVKHDWKYLYLTNESHCYLSFALRAIG